MAAARGAAFPPLTTTAFPCATEISHHSDPTSCRLPFGKITGTPYPKGREGVKENGLRVRRELWRRKPVTYRLLRRPEMEKPESCLCKTRGSPPGSPQRGKMVAQAPQSPPSFSGLSSGNLGEAALCLPLRAPGAAGAALPADRSFVPSPLPPIDENRSKLSEKNI